VVPSMYRTCDVFPKDYDLLVDMSSVLILSVSVTQFKQNKDTL
jgi:hypothetical protein